MNTLRMLPGVLILALLLAACGQQSTATSTPVDIEMAVRVEPEPPAVGESTLIVTLKDASGTPVDGAALRIHGDMDHAGMTPVDREINESTSGEYRVPFEWTMGGGWILSVTAQLPNGGEISRSFDFFVEAVSSQSVVNRHSGMSAETTPEHGMDNNAEATPDSAVNIVYEPDHNPAIAGDAVVNITLTDADGNPIGDAVVEVVGNMAHHGMMPVSGKGEHTQNGQYSVPLRWTMAGDWQVTVSVILADGSSLEKTFDQQVILPEN